MKPFYFVKREYRDGALVFVKEKSQLPLSFVGAVSVLIAVAMSIPASAQSISAFDAPGAGTGPLQGTCVTG